jgi:UDP-N-acetylglucosamine diphosphorylase / glucose-1-phosphate thymidylyltransferase / UDP-N-acetylgalactosamine diphosphorylase / glucosamine-1-phosphate N-acetyltransferase / galactosamine-1-phosphate N-acetyltransferase
MTPVLYLFDDDVARSWEPFSLTRPPGELLFGAFLLRERAERYWQSHCRGHLSTPGLVGFAEPGAPPVLDPAGLSPGGPAVPPEGDPRVFQSSRVALGPRAPVLPGATPATLILGGEVVGWIVPPGEPPPSPELLSNPKALPGSATLEVQGERLENVWDLMDRNARQLRDDIPRHFPGYAVEELPGSYILGDGLLSVGAEVTVEPGCVFDVSGGPIRLSDGVVVRAHTRLEGPAFVGPGSVILGGVLSGVSTGPVCKIRGEVESSVILGYTNKAHDGFLGHAYLGRWVNLGAFTTNSDLKNNYGPVRVGTASGAVDTGLLKVGCFLGDHVKTGIGTVLNTGTTVGAGCNLFGGRMPPTYVPPFSWGAGTDLTEYRLEPFLEVAARSMARRGMELDEGMAGVLSRAWESTRRLRSTGG